MNINKIKYYGKATVLFIFIIIDYIFKSIVLVVVIVLFFSISNRPALAVPEVDTSTYMTVSRAASENNPENKLLFQTKTTLSAGKGKAVPSLSPEKNTAYALQEGLQTASTQKTITVPALSVKTVDRVVKPALEDTASSVETSVGLVPGGTSLSGLSESQGASLLTRRSFSGATASRVVTRANAENSSFTRSRFSYSGGDEPPDRAFGSQVLAPLRNTRLQRRMTSQSFSRRICPCLPCFRTKPHIEAVSAGNVELTRVTSVDAGPEAQIVDTDLPIDAVVTITEGEITGLRNELLQARRQEGLVRQTQIILFYDLLKEGRLTAGAEIQVKYIQNSDGELEVRVLASAQNRDACDAIKKHTVNVFKELYKPEKNEIEHARGSVGAILDRKEQPCILMRKSTHDHMTPKLIETSALPCDFSAKCDLVLDGLGEKYYRVWETRYDTLPNKLSEFPKTNTKKIISHAFELTKQKEKVLFERRHLTETDYIPYNVFKQISYYMENGLNKLPVLENASNTTPAQILEKVKTNRDQVKTALQALTHLSSGVSDNLKQTIWANQKSTQAPFNENILNLSQIYSEIPKDDLILESSSWKNLVANPIELQASLKKVEFLENRHQVDLSLFIYMKREYKTLFP